jgi:hypothetical protein
MLHPSHSGGNFGRRDVSAVLSGTPVQFALTVPPPCFGQVEHSVLGADPQRAVPDGVEGPASVFPQLLDHEPPATQVLCRRQATAGNGAGAERHQDQLVNAWRIQRQSAAVAGTIETALAVPPDLFQ